MDCNIYLMMNKPCGYVCSAVSDRHKTVYSLLEPELQQLVQSPVRGKRLHTVGRLDCETSGLLLFTTDGNFSHSLTAPENKIEKKYIVKLHQKVISLHQKYYEDEFKKGIVLPAEKKWPVQKALPAEIHFSDESECIVTVTEGKFHLVRRMFKALGNEVTGLQRISFGKYILPLELAEGKYISLKNLKKKKSMLKSFK
ncbi:MAG: pseudouridine synthase [Treponema sp.]|nr:pseudouridine synthase [Treponema sp.]